MMRTIHERFAPGEVFVAADFQDIGTRAMVNQALSRLARSGRLTRLGAGLYYIPETSSYSGTPLLPAEDSVIKAFRRKNKERIMPGGATLANGLGLSEQVPAQSEYLTTGRARSFKLGNRPLTFTRITGRGNALAGTLPGATMIALRYLGRRTSKPNVLLALSRLSAAQKQQLRNPSNDVPKWMGDIFNAIAP